MVFLATRYVEHRIPNNRQRNLGMLFWFFKGLALKSNYVTDVDNFTWSETQNPYAASWFNSCFY